MTGKFNQQKAKHTRHGFSLEKGKKVFKVETKHQKPDVSSLFFKHKKSPQISPAVEAEKGLLLPCGMNICQVTQQQFPKSCFFWAVFVGWVIDLQLLGVKIQVLGTFLF